MEKIDLTQSTQRIRALDKGTLHRKLGILDIFGVAYGDIGSSIIYALGVVAFFAVGATPLAIGIAGIFFIFTALTYAELGATIPEAGGSGTFARRAFNSDLVSFIAGWALLLDYVLTASMSAYTICAYLGHFFRRLDPHIPGNTVWILGLASALILSLCALNVRGIRGSSRVSLVLTGIWLATFVVFIVWGFATVLDTGRILEQHRTLGTRPTWPDFLNAVALSMVAYIGIETGTQLAGEAKNPAKTVPSAIKITAIVLLAVYAGTIAIAMSIPGMTEALGTKWKEQPLLGVAGALPVIGHGMATWMSILAAILLFAAVNSGLIGSSRLAYSMASHFQLPRPFQILHPERKTPWFALVFFTIAAIIVLMLTQNMERLADLYNFGSLLAFTMAHLSLIGLRIREPNLDRPYKLRWNIRLRGREIPITAVLGLLATGSTWVYVVIHRPDGRWLGFGWLLVGFVLYMLVRRREEVSLVTATKIERVAVPEYKPWQVRHVLVPTLGGANTEVAQVASRIAATHGAQVTALYVIEVPEVLDLETFLPGASVAADKALDRAEAIGRECGVAMKRKKMQSRQAGPTIVEVAREEGCDLIVMGAAARPGVGSLFGKTVDHVARKAACRLMICSMTTPAK